MPYSPKIALLVTLSTSVLLLCCKGGSGADSRSAVPLVDEEMEDDGGGYDGSLPAIVVDPDDEAFGDGSDELGTVDDSDEGSDDFHGEVKGPVFTVKGVVTSVDTVSGLIVVDQLLADGRRHDVRFWTDSSTHVGWSKASMKMGLDELPLGITVQVTYHIVGKGSKRRNRAIKVIIPGGMQDVAKMILGDPEGVPSSSDKSQKSPKKH